MHALALVLRLWHITTTVPYSSPFTNCSNLPWSPSWPKNQWVGGWNKALCFADSALERGEEGSIQVKLSSTKGNRRGQSANKSAAATLAGFMKINLMVVLTEIVKVRDQISGGGRQWPDSMSALSHQVAQPALEVPDVSPEVFSKSPAEFSP